ncbi:hypothetical protein TYRP_014297, partial [Tyrophagus putrescentiae]
PASAYPHFPTALTRIINWNCLLLDRAQLLCPPPAEQISQEKISLSKPSFKTSQDSPFEEHFPNLKVIIIEDVKTRFENSLEEQLLIQNPLLQAGGHGTPIAQCQSARITTTRTIPMQVDGEPCKLLPSIIVLELRNKANLIAKTKSIALHRQILCHSLITKK